MKSRAETLLRSGMNEPATVRNEEYGGCPLARAVTVATLGDDMSLAKKVVGDILDKGLADSTWREHHAKAYEDLLGYREDLEASIEKFRVRDVLGTDGVKVKIMVVVPHYWAKGETIDEAWKSVRGIAGGNLRDLKRGKHVIYVCFDKEDAQTRLDEFGFNISYPQGYPPVIIHKHDV